jgi:hypothetical protein
MPQSPFGTLSRFMPPGQAEAWFYSLPALIAADIGRVARLPVSLRIVLEALLRHCDGQRVTERHILDLAEWQPRAVRSEEVPFVVARVVLQDFTGVPLLCDLAAMRHVAQARGLDPRRIEPLVPVDLVVDHSVQVDYYGTSQALQQNMAREFERNRERYQFMKWGMQAFETFRVVPPGVGIVHQVNLEHLFHGVRQQAIGSGRLCFPDTLVGTDSHTTMINGVGVVGWGVGGIEAEAAMLGQPVYFLTPDVVGVELSGRLREGVTATDLVLTVTELLRREKVVGTFVEYFGEGAGSLSVTDRATDRATLANMAPEYGATMGFFPVDEKTVDYMRATGRSEEDCVTAWLRSPWPNATVPLLRPLRANTPPSMWRCSSRWDQAHEDVCGPAIAHLLQRAYRDYGDPRYERLATLSVSHLYNLRKSAGYQAQRRNFTKTRPVCNAIGVRKAPGPEGRAGFVRIDTVHQGRSGRRQGRLSHHLRRCRQSVAGRGVRAGHQRGLLVARAGLDHRSVPVRHRRISLRQRLRVHQPSRREAAGETAHRANQVTLSGTATTTPWPRARMPAWYAGTWATIISRRRMPSRSTRSTRKRSIPGSICIARACSRPRLPMTRARPSSATSLRM